MPTAIVHNTNYYPSYMVYLPSLIKNVDGPTFVDNGTRWGGEVGFSLFMLLGLLFFLGFTRRLSRAIHLMSFADLFGKTDKDCEVCAGGGR